MIDSEIIENMQKKSIEERIYFIEILLQSIKEEIKLDSDIKKASSKNFVIRKFNLGGEVNVDRDEIYAERVK